MDDPKVNDPKVDDPKVDDPKWTIQKWPYKVAVHFGLEYLRKKCHAEKMSYGKCILDMPNKIRSERLRMMPVV